MAAQFVVCCLLEFHKIAEYHVVDRSAVGRACDHGCSSVAGGSSSGLWSRGARIFSVTTYLAFQYRYLKWGLSIAGLSAVTVQLRVLRSQRFLRVLALFLSLY